MRIGWRAGALSLSACAVALAPAIAGSGLPAAAPGGPATDIGADPPRSLAETVQTSGARAEPGGDIARLYGTLCLPCHGAEGRGDGPGAAWLWPPPRDFTDGAFKWRSTPTGTPPTRDDVALAIREGMPGTSMHGFGGILSESDIQALADRVLAMSGEDEPAADPTDAVSIPDPPPNARALVARGQKVWDELGCAQCHGDGGRGDGPSAPELKDAMGRPSVVFDLTQEPLRRPSPETEPPVVSIYRTLVTGLSGTPMPAYEQAASEDDLWAVSAYAASIAFEGEVDARAATTVSDVARRRDGARRLVKSARWPGGGEPGDEIPFGDPIELQGDPPDSLAPAQTSLSAEQCARCHKKQAREWRGSIHAFAGSPGLTAQLLQMEREGDYAQIESCQNCHNPLAEAQPALRAERLGDARGGDDPLYDSPMFDSELRDEGVNCATCHVRDWQRHGPDSRPGTGLRPQPGYPREELAIYERADFCLPCHQQTPRNSAVAGRPLLNTYREWLEGPYMPRGIQCQHCHMPNREHTFKGIHDRDTFRQAIDLETLAGRFGGGGEVSVRARLWNVGAGHFLPTTPTPAAWLEIRLLDSDGGAIEGARDRKRIGRHLVPGDGMEEAADTRIPPGEYAELAVGWVRGRVDEARYAEVVVRVEPQEFYERFYRARLRTDDLTGEERALYREALAWTQDVRYTALRRRIPIDGGD